MIRPWRACAVVALAAGLALASTAWASPALPYTSNLKLWLEADTGVTTNEGGRVSNWADQAFKDGVYDASQQTDGNRPLLVQGSVNARPAILFRGGGDGDDWLSGPAAAPIIRGTVARTIFTVLMLETEQATERTVFDLAGNGTNPADGKQYRVTPCPEAAVRVINGNKMFAQGPKPMTWHVMTVGNPANARTGGIRMWLDGAELGTKAVLDQLVNTGGAGYRIGHCARPNTGNPWDGWVAEILVYEEWLSDASRQAIEQYLVSKWKNVPPPGTLFLIR